MSAFGVFVIILTFIYVCYYATVIGMDLFKPDKKGDEEDELFPASPSDEEPSKQVSEDTDANGKPVYRMSDKWDEPEEQQPQQVEEAPTVVPEPQEAPKPEPDPKAAPQPQQENSEDDDPSGSGIARKKMEETREKLPDTISKTEYQESIESEPAEGVLLATAFNKLGKNPKIGMQYQSM